MTMTVTEKANILVVDDLPEKLLVYRTVLEELGQNVVAAFSGAEALKQVLLYDFAVILLDVNMPDMDGFETASLIRSRKKSMHTPIIFVTAQLDEMRAVQGYAHGAVDYILAPIAPEVFRAKVKVFVDLFHMNQQIKRQAEESIALAEEQAKRAAAEEANRSSAFLARASTVLANSMHFEATLRGLARVAVPFLADLSLVCLANETGQPTDLEWAWFDPLADKTEQASGDAQHLPGWFARAIENACKSGQREILSPIAHDTSFLAAGPAEPGRPNRYPNFSVTSAVVLPLNARGRTLGSFMLALGQSNREFSQDRLRLVEDLASRASIALDNALLLRDIQKADRRKDEFLAMLAHELRNPLAPICNAVEIMRRVGPAQPDLERARDVIDRQLNNLTRLVDDLLDVSRITSGKVRLKLETLDVAVAVASAVETSRPLIESRRQMLSVSLPSVPVRVRADQTRLAQVLANLLNNAAKYTQEAGHIWLDVSAEDTDVVFRVRDNGAGIAADVLPCIFDLFTQADQSLDRAQGGLGIGLTLVRRLVEMHHGSVQAISKGPGQGSEFVVRLAALAEDVPAEAPRNGFVHTPAVDLKRRILVVDDNMDTAESLAMLMRYDGHEVRTAHDGLAALQAFKVFSPEVVILDIGLPHLDGYEVARRLRDQSRRGDVLLAALTGYGNEEDQVRSQAAGFDLHLVKPVRIEALRSLLASHG